jgi:glycerophosphoryl diester phosphodiesterase
MVVAYQGYSAKYPENTMVSFEAAFDYTPAIECDLRLTSDGYIVVIHDATVDRTTTGTGNVADMTLAQIQSLDAGAWKGSKFANVNITVPTFEQVISTFLVNQERSAVMDLMVDGLGPALSTLLANYPGVASRLYASCSSDQLCAGLAQFQNLVQIPRQLQLTSLPVPADDAYFGNLQTLGYHSLLVNGSALTEDFVSAAHLRGFSVAAWVMESDDDDDMDKKRDDHDDDDDDDEVDVEDVVELGVDAVLTDDCEEAADDIEDEHEGDDDDNHSGALAAGWVIAILSSCALSVVTTALALVSILWWREKQTIFEYSKMMER